MRAYMMDRYDDVSFMVMEHLEGESLRAAIRGGMIHGLVTHASLARALLSRA